MIKNLLTLISCLFLLIACVGGTKPQTLANGLYVGNLTPAIYANNTSESEDITMNFNSLESQPNGKTAILDAHQQSSLLYITLVNQGTWTTITNGENGLKNPCFQGKISTTTIHGIAEGYPIAFVNCWLADGFIPGSYTFQAQYIIWNPASTINYGTLTGNVFLHSPN